VAGAGPYGLPFLSEVVKTPRCHRDQHDGFAVV
jgi:hypothetical protein